MLDDGFIPGGTEWSGGGVSHSAPTLRDQFAMAALTGLISGASEHAGPELIPIVAKSAYALADAMIAARMPDLSGLNEDALAMLAARGGK